jgi:hypothetical protein
MRAVSRQADDDALRSPAERQMTITIHGNRRLREAAGTDLCESGGPQRDGSNVRAHLYFGDLLTSFVPRSPPTKFDRLR